MAEFFFSLGVRMKAAKLFGIGDIRIVDEPAPAIEQGKVLVAMKSVGICGSDVHYFNQGKIGTQQCLFPQILGHECAGVVAKSFSESPFREGDRVAIEPGFSCGLCEHCLNGFQNRCPDVRFLGSPGMPGAYCDYIACKESQLAALPDSISYDEGAMLEPLGVAYHALCLSGIMPGATVAIFGAGPIGLLTAAMARHAGAGEIFIADRLAWRLAFAQEYYQIEHGIDITHTDPIHYILDHTRGRGVDIAFEAAGDEKAIQWTVASARIGGKALIIGIPETDTIALDPHGMRRKELIVQNVRRSNRALEPTLTLLARGDINVGALATHHYALNQIANAFRIVGACADNVLRAMVVF
jgi:L-iditol 2-dehydrogenase